MSQSTKKTLLFLLLLLIGIFGIFFIFNIAPALLTLIFLRSGLLIGFENWLIILPLLFVLIGWIVIVVWVYRDAERRALNGILWGLLVFFGNIIGLIIYLIVRSEQLPKGIAGNVVAPCPGCGKAVPQSHAFCHHCGARLKAVCGSCKKPVASDWQVCPYCGQRQNEEQR